MADYWKSQPRHFCEFCKCWTADNKPSRDFHERGKRHQDNVKKKLDELRKKGLADAKKEKEMSSYLKQMEKGAMSKLKADLTSDPSLASQYGVILKNKRKLNSDSESTCKPADSNCDLPAAPTSADNTIVGEQSSSVGGDWVEATTPEGYVYYWNTVTMESRWDPPDIDSQPSQVSTTSADVTEQQDTKDTQKQAEEITAAPAAKKQTKEITAAPAAKRPKKSKDKTAGLFKGNVTGSIVSTSTNVLQSPSTTAAPTTTPNARHGSAYGVWEEVKQDVEEPLIDLQLPQNITKSVEQKTLIVSNEPKIKFREKTVSSLSAAAGGSTDATSVNFRKPKTTFQRSIRSTKGTNLSEES